DRLLCIGCCTFFLRAEHSIRDDLVTGVQTCALPISETIIREYADAMTNGDAFPPIDVDGEETTYWLADGFHRVSAAKTAGYTTRSEERRVGNELSCGWRSGRDTEVAVSGSSNGRALR